MAESKKPKFVLEVTCPHCESELLVLHYKEKASPAVAATYSEHDEVQLVKQGKLFDTGKKKVAAVKK